MCKDFAGGNAGERENREQGGGRGLGEPSDRSARLTARGGLGVSQTVARGPASPRNRSAPVSPLRSVVGCEWPMGGAVRVSVQSWGPGSHQ